MSAIGLEGIDVGLDGRPVLEAVSLDLAQGSFTLVEGPSGSGKTTLLRVIAGLARPSAGRVALFGELASEGPGLAIPPQRRRVGFLFQGGGLWPHMSVRRTLEFVLRERRLAGADRDRRVAELVEWVELRGLEARRPGELSGGEAQRLSLARALAGDPRILLLDEPLGPLDARLRQALMERLGELHRRLGLTTLFVTHDPAEAARLADRVVRVDGGKVQI